MVYEMGNAGNYFKLVTVGFTEKGTFEENLE